MTIGCAQFLQIPHCLKEGLGSRPDRVGVKALPVQIGYDPIFWWDSYSDKPLFQFTKQSWLQRGFEKALNSILLRVCMKNISRPLSDARFAFASAVEKPIHGERRKRRVGWSTQGGIANQLGGVRSVYGRRPVKLLYLSHSIDGVS